LIVTRQVGCKYCAFGDGRAQTSGVRRRTSDFGPQTSDFGLRASGFRLLTSDFESQLQTFIFYRITASPFDAGASKPEV